MQHRESSFPATSAAFMLAAVLFLAVGVALGLIMAATNDHSLAPVHAHTNLLGWVSSALFGLFYALAPRAASPRWIWAHLMTHCAGVLLMMVGLTGVLTDDEFLAAMLGPGVALTLVAFLLFILAVCRTMFARDLR
jgi:hypothetical protein